MAQEQYTTSQRKFQHLTREKRAQIEILLRQGLPKVQIARAVGISRSTLYNELSRGTVEQIDTNLKKYRRYFWDAGQRVYEENRKNSRPPMKIMEAYDFVRYAERQILENRMSPDALCGDSFETVFKTVTSDNGSEFVDLGSYLPKSTKVYYAHPYSSYERGTNEKQNSLVRRFFPKGKSFENITDEQVAFVEHWINNLPRKIFNYHCSDFVFHNVLFDIAI